MRIERRMIRNADRYLSALPPNSTFKVISEVDDAALSRAGFEIHPDSGDNILPAIVGRVTRFNAEGRWIARRDLPKEYRIVGSRIWTRTEWHGRYTEEVEDTVYIHRWCYPRDFLSPPSVELTFLTLEGRPLMISPTLTYASADAESNKHVINMMLELFGSCEIVLENLAELSPAAERRVNWAMLPPGEHPWDHIVSHVEKVFSKKSPTVASAVLLRQEIIRSFEPTSIYRGLAGFSDYIAYTFPSQQIVVLESVFYGNALYVLGDNWEAVSRLTKSEIINGGLALERIIHSKGWVANLASALRAKAAE